MESTVPATTSAPVMSTDLATLFKALAHPKRLAILETLRDAERCVCEIEEALDLRQAYVSQQLTVLREAGLVCYRKDGWNVYYRIALYAAADGHRNPQQPGRLRRRRAY